MYKDIQTYLKYGKRNIIFIYFSYLLGVLHPFLPLAGAYFAYRYRNSEDKFLRSHYTIALRTFIFISIGWLVTLIFYGEIWEPIIHVVVFFMAVVRSVIALNYFFQQYEHPNPTTLWIK